MPLYYENIFIAREAMMRDKTGQPCSCPVLYMYLKLRR
ncbi:hypothetical protein HMPREF1153_0073 [Selenomonas sp. CM52]|nr:hypothetical protein HMPREF1153_0073 [Selenomonas sp. CM52]